MVHSFFTFTILNNIHFTALAYHIFTTFMNIRGKLPLVRFFSNVLAVFSARSTNSYRTLVNFSSFAFASTFLFLRAQDASPAPQMLNHPRDRSRGLNQ